jgi:beta-glucosidase
LPQPLEDAGGWPQRSVVDAFEEYAGVCFKELGDLVDMWITLNEPLCTANNGYLNGRHAPGICDQQKALAAVHHLNMAHGAAVKAYRKTGLKAPIGITWNPVTPRPATSSAADKKAAEIARAFATEIYMFPCLGKGYPEIVTKEFNRDLSHRDLSHSVFPVQSGDMETIAQPIDFIGVNYYFENPVAADAPQPSPEDVEPEVHGSPLEKAQFKFSDRPSWQNCTDMNWPIVPGGLERQLLWIAEISKGAFGKKEIPVYITENGCARNDEIEKDGRVHDRERIDYLKQHFLVIADLIKKGLPIKGYYMWSLLDNFEWLWGYTKRFGIVYVDYFTQKRTPKDSAYFMRDVIAGFGEW